MIKTFWKQPDAELVTGDDRLISQWQQNPASFIWVDVQYGAATAERVSQLLESFGCDKLVVKDVLRKRHPPKYEVFSQQIFILYRGISEVLGSLEFRHQQIGFFIGKNYLLTVHPEESLGIGAVMVSEELHDLVEHPMRLALKVMHSSSATYLKNLLAFEDELGREEDALESGLAENVLTKLASHRLHLLRLKRIFNYHYQMFRELCDLDERQVPLPLSLHEHYLIDVYDRFERLFSLTSLYYEMCSDMIEGYISVTTHQQNITMRLLTVVMAIFVPLSFLAGLYGMNFDNMPELHNPNGYYVVLIVMALVTIGLVVTFKWKKWF